MQKARHIQGYRTVVYIHEYERSAQEVSRRDCQREMDSRVGQGQDRGDAALKARLVHIEAEGVGSAHHGAYM